MNKIIFKGHIGIGDAVQGEALVANDNFSARYDLDRNKGIFSRKSHKLFKQSYINKILVLNVAKGGVASAWMLKSMIDIMKFAIIKNKKIRETKIIKILFIIFYFLFFLFKKILFF